MTKNKQIVKMSTSIIDYFKMVMDFDNENEEYKAVAEKEFKKELTKALNCEVANKEIIWVDENKRANYSLEVWKMILKFSDFWNTCKPELIASEIHLLSHEHKYAGTCDLVVKIDDKVWLLDTKTSGVEKIKLYSEAIEQMYTNENLPELFREIFKNSFLPFKYLFSFLI